MATNCAAAPMANNLALSMTPPPVPETFESVSYKSKLQEYTQKASLPFPVYQTLKEGPPHACVFRSTVWVNGLHYVSSTVFLQRKAAEQDAARVALLSCVPPLAQPQPQIVNHAEAPHLRPFINQDTTFAKSILIEYAAKKHIENPVYATIQLAGKTPVFSSSVAFDGKAYNGHVSRSKKEAEQLAARAAILSILDSHGEDIYDIINAKHKLYGAINGLKETLGASNDFTVSNSENRVDIDMNKRKGLTDVSINIPSSTTSLSIPNFNTALSTCHVPASSETVLETVLPSVLAQSAKKQKKKDKRTATMEDQHVPAISETVLHSGLAQPQSAKKKKKKNKKAATREDDSETVLSSGFAHRAKKQKKKDKRTATMEDQHVPAISETVLHSGLAQPQSAKKKKKNKKTATREDESGMTCDLCNGCGYASRHPVICI